MSVQPTLDLLENVIDVLEDGVVKIVMYVLPTLDLLDNVINA